MLVSLAGRLLVLFLLLPVLWGCHHLEPPEETGELVVAVRSGPSSYQVENGSASGFEYDLIEAFAASLHYRVRYVVAGDQAELRTLLRQRRVHFAASAWVDGLHEFLYTPPVRESAQVVVSRTDDPALDDDPPVLDGAPVEAMVASPQVEALQALAGTPPRFPITVRHGTAEFALLQDVADGTIRFAATDRLQYNLALHYLPNLEIAFELPGKIGFGWAFNAEDETLRDKARNFIDTARRDGTLARLHDRYFGYITRIRPDGVISFLDDIKTLLPRYRRDFQNAQEITGVDWRLLAAIAYQESKWDPLATSPTGVRGMMMLTEDTADRLRISNRLDPKQSIRGGAKYFADLRDQLPDEVAEPDRTWLALAAYNLGMGHLNGARTFAVGLKRDPNVWYDMKTVLPLMSRPEYYERLKSGKARGGEAVIMVENIRTFYGILAHFEPPWQPPSLRPRKAEKSAFGLKLPSAFQGP